jgi:hypothetical protein
MAKAGHANILPSYLKNLSGLPEKSIWAASGILLSLLNPGCGARIGRIHSPYFPRIHAV